MAESCTNRQPQNVLTQVFLRLQVLLNQGKLKVKETKVVRAAKGLKAYEGTSITKEFVSTRMRSWQVHLRRISPYLSRGEGVWWTQTDTAYHFLDGEQHPNTQPQGPPLQHFRSMSRKLVEENKGRHWDDILQNHIALPAPHIQLYDRQGNPTEKMFFPSASSPRPTADTSQPLLTSTPTTPGVPASTLLITPITPTAEDSDTSDDSENDTQGHEDFTTLGTQVHTCTGIKINNIMF